MSDSSSVLIQVSPRTFITLLLQQPKFLLLQHKGLLSLTLTSQVDGMCFVSENGDNVFQDNHVKLCVDTFVYVYFINMKKKKRHRNFLFKNPFKKIMRTTSPMLYQRRHSEKHLIIILHPSSLSHNNHLNLNV